MFDDRPPHSQITLPLAISYPRTRFVPLTITCGLPACSMIRGVAQEVTSFRCDFHSSLPVFLSSAAMKDCPSWSQLMISVSL